MFWTLVTTLQVLLISCRAPSLAGRSKVGGEPLNQGAISNLAFSVSTGSCPHLPTRLLMHQPHTLTLLKDKPLTEVV